MELHRYQDVNERDLQELLDGVNLGLIEHPNRYCSSPSETAYETRTLELLSTVRF